MWQDTNYSRIDSTVIKVGDYYYRFTKNEESGAAGSYITNGKSTFLERSKVLTATTEETSPDTDPETAGSCLTSASCRSKVRRLSSSRRRQVSE